jgi:hypothetical protein
MKKDDDLLKRRLAALAERKAPAPPAFEPKKKARPERAARLTTFRFARIVCADRSQAACIIRDLSETGARIVLEGEAALSPVVILKIEQTGARKTARVVWQRGREAGLAFVEPPR